jgi:ureidoglycolate dehydrogenase (NAD+)
MTEAPVRVAVSELEAFCRGVFTATGFSADDAHTQTDVLIWANLRGVDSHGIMRIPRYVTWLKSGVMRADAVMRISKERGAAAIVDAGQGPGAVAMSYAMRDALQRANADAIGWTVVRQTTHSGAVGYYAAMAAQQNMAGIAVATSRPNMAYFGARAAGVATTPIAIAVPGGPDGMLMLDMSTSQIPLGKIRAARATGEPLPGVCALTDDGQLTDDPNRAAIPLPLGGPKGSGLSLLFECLTGVLSGNPLLEPALTGAQKGHAQNGLVIAIDIEAFSGVTEFKALILALASSIKGLPAMDTDGEVMLPGEPEVREAERRKDGIPIPEKVWMQLAETARDLDVSLPPTLQ